jgi:hypothetical protein
LAARRISNFKINLRKELKAEWLPFHCISWDLKINKFIKISFLRDFKAKIFK